MTDGQTDEVAVTKSSMYNITGGSISIQTVAFEKNHSEHVTASARRHITVELLYKGFHGTPNFFYMID